MAKSLRSKSKRSFRRIKRDDPKSDYHIRDKLRLQRLNEKLKVLTPVSDDEEEVEENGDDEEAVMQADADVDVDAAAGGASKVGTSTSKGKGKGKKVEQDEAVSAMETEATTTTSEQPEKKISTGGPRESSRMEWRKKAGMVKKRTSANSTTFNKQKNYKSPGRVRSARK